MKKVYFPSRCSCLYIKTHTVYTQRRWRLSLCPEFLSTECQYFPKGFLLSTLDFLPLLLWGFQSLIQSEPPLSWNTLLKELTQKSKNKQLSLEAVGCVGWFSTLNLLPCPILSQKYCLVSWPW